MIYSANFPIKLLFLIPVFAVVKCHFVSAVVSS